jgi:predicted Zn-ribbon and HTH transcriptional regulator
MSSPPKIMVRSYRGSQEHATAIFRADAEKLAKQGYYPTSQTWAAGAYGCGAFILALLLCFVLIGFIVFLYMLIVKPDGTLTVTYEYRDASVSGEKICPRCAETVKVAAAVCRFCGHEFDTGNIRSQAQIARSAPASCPVDPFALGRKSELTLREQLAKLSIGQLRQVVADCNLDSTGYAVHWNRGDLIQYIVQQTMGKVRSEEGGKSSM